MAHHSDTQLKRTGAITIVLIVVALTAAFNIGKLPWLAGTTYKAEFADASGLHVGNRVEIAGIRVGRVSDISIEGAKVVVSFSVDDEKIGERTAATIGVLNLLGEKYLNLSPRGGTPMAPGDTIPLARTTAGYDVVSTMSQLTDTTERIDTDQLSQALTALSGTLDQAGPQVHGAFTGLAQLSQTIAARGDELDSLLKNAHRVVAVVNSRKKDLVGVMKHGDQVFAELIQRRNAIHQLLVSATELSEELRALVRDNQRQIGPALASLDKTLDFLNERQDELTHTIKAYGPYASILINIIGTGPWFDAYLANFPGIASGEFVPGQRQGLN